MKRLLRRPLQIREILAWADAFRESTGRWPIKDAGAITATRFETWLAVDRALRAGLRGLPGDSSLARLLAEKRQVRNVHKLPFLSEELILRWADEFHEGAGSWPTVKSGTIPNSGGEKWLGVDMALRKAARGLPTRSSLAQLLALHRGVRNRMQAPLLTEQLIVVWADSFFHRTGTWPTDKSGSIKEALGETWTGVTMALRNGTRGLPGGSSLALLLAEHRGVRNSWTLPNLTIRQILSWVDAWHEQTGEWPRLESGPIPVAPGETWCAVNHAIKRGSRGLPKIGSLAKLLERERGVRNRSNVRNLRRKEILTWARAYHRRTGKWPTIQSGPISEVPGETWAAMDAALRQGCRGLREGSSLARLFADHQVKRNHLALAPLSHKKILAWADAHHGRRGKWPNTNSGPVDDAPGEKWNLIDNSLRIGNRGLPGGSSLLLLLSKKRGVRNPLDLPPLSEDHIFHLARRHQERAGAWPQSSSGTIVDAPGETWCGIDNALRFGKRGLFGGSSLAKLLEVERKNLPETPVAHT